MKDEIIQELWRVKDELARKAKYDIHALCRELRKNEGGPHTHVVERSATRRAAAVGRTKR